MVLSPKNIVRRLGRARFPSNVPGWNNLTWKNAKTQWEWLKSWGGNTTVVKLWMFTISIYYMNWGVLWGFTPLRKTVLPLVKNSDTFSRGCWDGQSAAYVSLAIFSAMNEWQRVLFFKRELSRLHRVCKVLILINKIIHGCFEVWNFSCSTRYLTSERSERLRYRVENSKWNYISPRSHVLFSINSTQLNSASGARLLDSKEMNSQELITSEYRAARAIVTWACIIY